ncbi:hypothetical protein [Fictibacillus sp. NRS-1165]|uniref:hypothetical protein n=1 Tax=Fictibacillus sp. NRS-1165 TaxID=3144463 RepID=UPI003D1BD7ED
MNRKVKVLQKTGNTLHTLRYCFQNPILKRKTILLLTEIEKKHNIPGLSKEREVERIFAILKHNKLLSVIPPLITIFF